MIDLGRKYIVSEAILHLKKIAGAKFDESVDVSVNLGIDPKKSDQVVRRATVLPHGTGKTVRVAVFAQGDLADIALLHTVPQPRIMCRVHYLSGKGAGPSSRICRSPSACPNVLSCGFRPGPPAWLRYKTVQD